MHSALSSRGQILQSQLLFSYPVLRLKAYLNAIVSTSRSVIGNVRAEFAADFQAKTWHDSFSSHFLRAANTKSLAAVSAGITVAKISLPEIALNSSVGFVSSASVSLALIDGASQPAKGKVRQASNNICRISNSLWFKAQSDWVRGVCLSQQAISDTFCFVFQFTHRAVPF
jgi:hypothetical protein